MKIDRVEAPTYIRRKVYEVNRNVVYKNIVEDLELDMGSVVGAIELFSQGATVPFIARYRKERTGGLDEIQLRKVRDKMLYYAELEKRKETIVESIASQGKLSDELKSKIISCREKQVLEDLYLPYKPKKQTKATVAMEKGLGPLAVILSRQQAAGPVEDIVKPFINSEKGVDTLEDALAGAIDILVENINDDADIRKWLREHFSKTGLIVTSPFKEWADKKSKYDMYYNFREYVRDSQSHRLLAIRRGAKEKVIYWDIEADKDQAIAHIESRVVINKGFVLIDAVRTAVKKAYTRMTTSIRYEVFSNRLEEAEEEAINVFSKNLRNLLLDPPAGHKMIMGVDPGFVTGCKVAVVDNWGNFLEFETIFPHPPQNNKQDAGEAIAGMVRKHKVELIAIGNGTASRETMTFVKAVIRHNNLENVKPIMVSEAGASVYSASEVAIEEFPKLDVTVRGAISIARRLQDPLSELVKVDPKSIGVGQYQHDVNQRALKSSLDSVVESCVNYVGVELNTASKELLKHISGLGDVLAENIVKFREKKGAFSSRKDLMNVPMLGERAYEQCAGFLRIRSSKNALDNSSIHPESYHIVEKMAEDLSIGVDKLVGNKDMVKRVSLKDYVTETTGLPTLEDIKTELLKPGLDPRKEFSSVEFREDVQEISDLKPDMKLFGKITNVTNFGAFVDIGVHQDGLIHISNLSRKFVKDPHDEVSVGDRVRVKVLSVDTELKRIDLERIQ